MQAEKKKHGMNLHKKTENYKIEKYRVYSVKEPAKMSAEELLDSIRDKIQSVLLENTGNRKKSASFINGKLNQENIN